MSSIIQVLPDHVANQIAAGEVVQRPASVIKELMENAVDAKATEIKVILKDSGKTLIQIVDNGIGMSITDARLCFERHATSKIRYAEDLFHINTKGFRGEALASIAAVAHVELKTKNSHEELGTHIIIEGSKFVQQEPCVTPKGTSFSIKHLFFNIPARRNFLKSDAVELRHIIDEFQRVALAHPDIDFTLIHQGNDVYRLPASSLRQRIVGVFGGKSNEKYVPVQEQTEWLKINGFVGKPEFAKRTRGEQFFFVNSRFIKSGYLHHAVMNAFEGLLKDGFHPSYFIYLEIDPGQIDVNIHPTKTEIKFEDENAIYSILRACIKHSLGQYQIQPPLDFDRDASMDLPYHYTKTEVKAPEIEVDTFFNPFESTVNKNTPNTGFSKSKSASWESLYLPSKDDFLPMQDSTPSELHVEQNWSTGALFDSLDNNSQTSNKFFQIQRKYIVGTIKSGLVVLDQHRAHQRVLYEKFVHQLQQHKGHSQSLLFPLVLEFDAAQAAVLQGLKMELETVGFQLTFLDATNVQVDGIPTEMKEGVIPSVLDQIIHDYEHLDNAVTDEIGLFLAKSLSKSMAIKRGVTLTESEMQSLFDALFACEEAQMTPFFKKTYSIIGLDELDKKFEL